MKQKIIKPNCGIIENKLNHILKVICGVGKHCPSENEYNRQSNSKKAVLKYLIYDVLKNEMGYEAYMNEDKGNVLVRL